MNCSELASDHAHGVQKRKLVRIDVRFEGGLVHQTAHGKNIGALPTPLPVPLID